jgi:hypothetical protein
MWRAWLAATFAMMVGVAVYYAALGYISNEVVLLFGYGIPVLGAAVAAFLAPRNKFNVGAAKVIPAILVVGIGGYIAGALGFGDSIGLKGSIIVTVLSIPLIALASAIGALFGEWAAKGRANA